MSEFLSICPKCRQQILCDTTYVGMRVACPLCLQEITMPEAPVKGRSSMPVPGSGASVSQKPPASAEKRSIPLSLVTVGILVLIAAAGLGIWMIRSQSSKPRPAPPPVASLPPTALPNSNLQQRKPTTPVVAPPILPSIVPSAVPLVSVRPNLPPGSRLDSVQEAATPSEPSGDCRALWTFDQDGGFRAMDTSGNGFNAALEGVHAIWTKDARVGGGALKLSDSSYAEVSRPVVDTSRSFSVAAWVKLSAIDKINCQSVVGIDGTNVSAFFLQLNHLAGDCFVFLRLNKDQDVDPITAKAQFAAKLDTWYFLVGVYDEGAGMISLYVDAKLQESVPFTSPWRATGKTSIGRGLYGKRNVDFLNGTVDDIRFYASALTAKQIQILAAN